MAGLSLQQDSSDSGAAAGTKIFRLAGEGAKGVRTLVATAIGAQVV